MLFCFFTECFSSLFCLYPYLLVLQLFYGSFILLKFCLLFQLQGLLLHLGETKSIFRMA